MEKLKKVGELQGFDYDDICEVIEVLEKQGFVVTDNDLSETNWNSYNILKKNKYVGGQRFGIPLKYTLLLVHMFENSD